MILLVAIVALVLVTVRGFISRPLGGRFASKGHRELLRQRLSTTQEQLVGTAGLDWTNLGFEYSQTANFIQIEYKNGEWGEIKKQEDPFVKIHIGATALHYGQACFEGLKAFQCKDKSVKIFRPDMNAKRIADSCKRVCMPPIPEDKFLAAIKEVVKDNLAYVPPYGSSGALYIRPVLFGSGPKIGLSPSEEYKFVVLAMPVADYYKGGLQPVQCVVIDDYDRAAPRGVGAVKVAGNYAADMLPNMQAKKAGYPIGLYLDAKTNSMVEEFSTSNFIAVDRQGALVTPDSSTILPSVTRRSLEELARDEGLDVQCRQVPISEVMDGNFSEVAACGTAVVVTPVNRVVYKTEVVSIGEEGVACGPVIKKLYDRVRNIQTGQEPDKLGWMMDID